MTFEQYCHEASEFARYPRLGNNLNYTILGLVGEAGEVANAWKKYIRDCENKEVFVGSNSERDIIEELGDVLWYFMACCSELDISPSKVAALNIRKLERRTRLHKATLRRKNAKD